MINNTNCFIVLSKVTRVSEVTRIDPICFSPHTRAVLKWLRQRLEYKNKSTYVLIFYITIEKHWKKKHFINIQNIKSLVLLYQRHGQLDEHHFA